MRKPVKTVTRGAEEARQNLPAILDAAAAGSGRKLWGSDSSKTLADLRDEWSR